MAVLEGHRPAADPADLVGGALAKIIRVLPTPVAPIVRSIRDVTGAPAGSAAPGSAVETGECTAPAEARVSPAADQFADRGLRGRAAAAADLPARTALGR